MSDPLALVLFVLALVGGFLGIIGAIALIALLFERR